MKNLLEETKRVLADHNKSMEDVVAIQGEKFGISIDRFIKLADRKYDSGFGGTEVAEDLKVIGDGWWLERHEYDGSEWWEFKEMPKILPISENVTTLFSGYKGLEGVE